MKFGDIKCTKCGGIVDKSTIIVLRDNIKNDDAEDYFADVVDKTLCRDVDNLFVKGTCSKCKSPVFSMVVLDAKPTDYYSADNLSKLSTFTKTSNI